MKLGTLVRLSNAIDAEAHFTRLREAGYSACQLVYKPAVYEEKDAKIIRRAAEATGIDISAQFCGYYDGETSWDNYYGFMNAGIGVPAYRASRMAYVKSAINFARSAGVTDAVIHAGFIPNNPFASDYAPILTAVGTLCEYCGRLGSNLLLETGGESGVALLRLIEDTRAANLFINLDPANMLMYGYANPIDALGLIGKYVRNIHGKDGCPPTTSRALGKEMPLGEGRVDFSSMFRILRALGYDRYVIIERELWNDAEKQKADVALAKEYLERVLTEVGYSIE